MTVINKLALNYTKFKYDKKTQVDLYHKLLWPRLIEEKMINLLRQGRISKWFSGIGQEAISVGVTAALEQADFLFPMHRNLGVFTTRGIPLKRLLSQWEGKANGFTKGRDRSFHFGAPDYGIVGMISHLGPQLSLASGVALANLLRKEPKVSVAFTGDGGTSQGEFHEALNVAAVWNLPVIFIVENNGYGLSTPSNQQFKAKQIADKGIGFGMKSMVIDGNNILEVFQTIQKVAKDMRKNPQPILIECMTFRMFGHEMASGTKYVPKALLEKWRLKDPLLNFEEHLLEKGFLSQDAIHNIKKEIKAQIQKDVDQMSEEPAIIPNLDLELEDVYAPHLSTVTKANNELQEMRFVDAITDGLNEAMNKHEDLVLMGQDIADYGGVFKVTDGLMNRYGADRVRNTPLCESAILGIALGLSIRGIKSMVEMQFADFVSVGFNQIINNLAKIHYRWGQNADVVIRMPTGGGMGAGPFHSQSTEAWFVHTPGLKVLYPSNPTDAKGMLLAAFEDPNPILFFEHKALYRGMKEEVPKGYYTTEIGKARTVLSGTQAVIITYGIGVQWAKKIVAEKSLDIEILDLRSLLPLDYSAIDLAVKKTNRVLLLHEDTLTGGIGGELSAYISENLFEYLDAPIIRVASLDTPIPFEAELEKQFLAENRLGEQIDLLLNY